MSPHESSPASPDSLYRQASRAAAVGLVVNLLLGIAKLAGGIFGHSYALVADAVNSIGDSVTSLATLAALWYAQRPPDDEHPYGHTRVEAAVASNIALAIMIAAFLVGWGALERMDTPQAVPPVWTLWVAGANLLIKEGLFWYSHRVGKRTGSAALVATAWDHRSDAFCSLAVLVGLGIARYAGDRWLIADEFAALVVVLVILISGAKLFRGSTSALLDPQADPEVVDEVRRIATETPGVRCVEKLRVRKTGMEFLVDIHIQVDATMTVRDGHNIGHRVKERIVSKLAPVRDVLVHLEPFPHSGSVQE